MVENMKDNIKMIKNKVMVYLLLGMVEFIKANGRMEFNMEKVFSKRKD